MRISLACSLQNFQALLRGCEEIGTATDFDEILLQFFWKKGQEFRKSGPVMISSQPPKQIGAIAQLVRAADS